MDNVKLMALLVLAEAANHGRENILPALEIPLAAVSLTRCIDDVTNIVKQEGKWKLSIGSWRLGIAFPNHINRTTCHCRSLLFIGRKGLP